MEKNLPERRKTNQDLSRNPLRERIFYVKLDRVLVPLAMSGIEEMIKGTHPSFQGIKPAAKAKMQLAAMIEVMYHMPKRIEDKMDAKEIAEISRRPGVIIFPMQTDGTNMKPIKVLNQAEILDMDSLEDEKDVKDEITETDS